MPRQYSDTDSVTDGKTQGSVGTQLRYGVMFCHVGSLPTTVVADVWIW